MTRTTAAVCREAAREMVRRGASPEVLRKASGLSRVTWWRFVSGRGVSSKTLDKIGRVVLPSVDVVADFPDTLALFDRLPDDVWAIRDSRCGEFVLLAAGRLAAFLRGRRRAFSVLPNFEGSVPSVAVVPADLVNPRDVQVLWLPGGLTYCLRIIFAGRRLEVGQGRYNSYGEKICREFLQGEKISKVKEAGQVPWRGRKPAKDRYAKRRQIREGSGDAADVSCAGARGEPEGFRAGSDWIGNAL